MRLGRVSREDHSVRRWRRKPPVHACSPKAMCFSSHPVFSPASSPNTDRKPACCLVSVKGKTLSKHRGWAFQFRTGLVTGRNCPGAREGKLDFPTHESQTVDAVRLTRVWAQQPPSGGRVPRECLRPTMLARALFWAPLAPALSPGGVSGYFHDCRDGTGTGDVTIKNEEGILETVFKTESFTLAIFFPS